MQAWPLEKIPHLGEQAFTAILQSLWQQEMGKNSPLESPARPLEEFSALRWQDAGCDLDLLQTVTGRFAAMFELSLPRPALGDKAGDLAARALHLWQQGQRPVTFFTSGSTGQPKPCTHLEAHLRQEITSLAPLLHNRRSALVMAPLHHLYGFTFGLLLPLSLGIPIRTCPALPTVVAAQMRPGDVVVGIPLLWSRLVELKGWQGTESRLGEDITLFTATSPTPEETMLALLQQGFTVLEFFGASEVGVVCSRRRPDEPFTLLPHVRRARHGGEEVLQRLLPGGELRNYPILDTVAWVDEQRFYPRGRKDKAVQVGGVNVFPHRVQEVLLAHEGVAECAVRLMRPEEGYRLKAFIVPAPGREPKELVGQLRTHARKMLCSEEIPAMYTCGHALPRTALGKVTDW